MGHRLGGRTKRIYPAVVQSPVMGTLPPIYRLADWFRRSLDRLATKERPAGVLRCADCLVDVGPDDGIWDDFDGVVLCSQRCFDDWQTDRAF